MKHPVTITFLLLLFCLSSASYAQDESPEELFEDGDFFYARGDYSEAVYLYRQVLKAEPYNANIKYKIGMALLNIPGEEYLAIPYFEEALENLTMKYRKNRYQVKQAPYHTWFFLGTAYRINNDLEKSLEAYQSFMSVKDFEKHYNVRLTEEEIKAVGRAKIIQDAPLDLYKFCFEEPLNSEGSEYNAVISADEQVMVWMISQKFYEAIMMSFKKNGKWSSPINITPQLGSDGDMVPTGLSKDGKQLLLVRHGEFDSDIYLSRYDGTLWSKAEPVPGEINSNFTEDYASFALGDRRIIFSSEQRGTMGGLDIFYSELRSDNNWGEPINMGAKVNTEFDETSCHISPDESMLIFSSKGHYNMGGYDLFYCNLDNGRVVGDPVNMGYPINTTNDNSNFIPLKDGMSGIYAMQQEDGLGGEDIWYLEIIPFSETIARSQTRLSEKDFTIQITNKDNGEVLKLTYDSINDKISISSGTGTHYGVVYSREDND